MVTRAQIVAEARSWVGVPFRHMGRDRGGVDCIGLVVVVARALGIPVRDWEGQGNYTRRGQGFEMVRHIIDTGSGELVPLKEARDGDVVLFAEAGIPCHAGIVFTRDGRRFVIQAYGQVSYRRVVETPYSVWETKARYAFRFPGVED